jgi:predicted Zn-dependent protease
MPHLKPLITALLVIISLQAISQTQLLYRYQDLSHLYYLKQKDSLTKAWACPSLYKEKETQKKYGEIWNDRIKFITDAIKDDDFIHDTEVHSYVEGIITQIVQANKAMIPVKPLLFIDRSPSVNAYAIGNNIIAVNLGLIAFSQTREELALAIAHELSHNILNHPDNAMKQRAEWLTSKEYKESLTTALDSKYERLSRIRKVLENYSFNRSRHQRYKESDADSMAILLLKKSSIAFNPDFFLRLDSSDNIYHTALKQPVKNYFTAYNLPLEESWMKNRSKGLSTKTYDFSDSTSNDDSLKTHPECVERYNKTRSLADKATLTPVPAQVHHNATKMIIWNMYNNGAWNQTACLYRIFLEKDKGNTDEWYDFMVTNVINRIYFFDNMLHRFKALGVKQKEYISRDYFAMQTMLEQMPREQLEKYCKTLQDAPFWKNMSPAENGFKKVSYALALDPYDSDPTKKTAKEFTSRNSTSMYCEYADGFD